ncbi:hypothetical protein AXF42_Ash006923 [Apostasia shenzhenica]|uniref:Uncharacterized protein n=1 Tax=Apostasia shenzhenica TaxID=1088818 RepID=A0A2I0BEN8_9ASPA|nr:hypothetical protein AXF42_Ash006923 [Apostasia shenzhenica]
MTGIFSRLAGGWSGHQAAQSATESREALTADGDIGGFSTTAEQDFEAEIMFRPVEHPVEPINNDQPVQCPLPEPSILNDGKIWKQRFSSTGAKLRADLQIVKEGLHLEKDGSSRRRPRSAPRSRPISATFTASENQFLKLFKECNAAGNRPCGF